LATVKRHHKGKAMSRRVGRRVRAVTVAILAASSFAVCAAPDESPQSVRIDIRDLDLTTSRDVERLYARIRRAARRVCEWQVSVVYLQVARSSHKGCYGATVSETVARLNLAPLTTEHQRGGGR
jgi:UrcA family protein